ncbi:MAG: hypothetical protein KBS59_04200, partial [Clostridiales bacterium]|nr:hypothetical protein [Clostridiales bacterium]
ISPTTSAQSSYSGSIKRDSSKVVISGLEGDTSYTLYVKVYNENTSLSEAYELSFKTTRLVSILDAGKTSSTISVKYETNIIYKIGNSDWTDAYGYNLPTASNPAALGGGIEFYYDNSINPTVITFSGLEQNTSYTIKAKYYTDPDSNAISKPIATRECSHIFGDKIYGADGLTYTRTCSRCGYVQTGKDSLADCQHLHTETKTVPSTCAAQGYTVNVCSVCGKEISQRQLLPIVSHVYDHDCDDTCNLCGAKRQITGHIFIDFTKPSSCSEKGYTVKKCARCGYEDILSKVELPLLEHTPGEWEVMHEPTDTADGFKVKKCTECGKILETADISRITRTENQNGTITYKLSSGGDSVALSEIASKAVGESGDVKITFVNESVEIQFDRTMTAALIADGATLTLKKVDAASASGDLTKAGFIGDGFTVYEISLENAVFVGKNGKATITMSYECSDGLSASVYYVAPDGTKTRMTAPKGKTVYDAATKTITFETSHFSTYVVAEEIGVPAKPKSNGAIIAIIAVAAVVIATAGTFGYIVFISKRTKKKGFKF